MAVQEQRTGTRRTVQACANVALVVASVIAGLLLGELGYRLAGYTAPGQIAGPNYYPRFYFKADPVNGFDIAENFADSPFEFPEYIRTYGAPFTVSSNSLGCRDRSFDQEDGYVLLLGDSFTWGFVPLEQTWGTILEQLIGIRVLKCGVGGYGPLHERHKLEAVVAKAGRPRLVIVGYTEGNDLLDDYLYPVRTVIDGYLLNKVELAEAKRGGRKVKSDGELQARLKSYFEQKQKPVGFITGAKKVVAEHSVLYNLLRNSLALRRMAAGLGMADPQAEAERGTLTVNHSFAEYPWLEQAWEEHLTNLRKLKSTVEAVGATMLVVLIPDSHHVYEFLRPQYSRREWVFPNQRLTEFFQSEGIAFLDLTPEFRRYANHKRKPKWDVKEDLYWPQDRHPNAKGNSLAGLLISRYVLEQRFLDLHDKSRRLSDIKQLLSASTDVNSVSPQ